MTATSIADPTPQLTLVWPAGAVHRRARPHLLDDGGRLPVSNRDSPDQTLLDIILLGP